MKKLTTIILFALIASGMTAQTDSDYTRWMIEDRLMNDTYSEPYSPSMTEMQFQDYMTWQMNNSGVVYLPADHSGCYSIKAVKEVMGKWAKQQATLEAELYGATFYIKGINLLFDAVIAERDSLQRRVEKLEVEILIIKKLSNK